MKKAGLLINPLSGHSSGKGLHLAQMLQGKPNVMTRILAQFEQLPYFLDELAGNGVTDLFISSGDGTIQAVQTELAERRPFRAVPRLSLLPHGTTNMTAADLGFRHHSLTAQAEFIGNLEAAHLRERPTLRIVNPRDGNPRHGMFVGAGAATEATRFCQDALNAHGVKGSWAVVATLAKAAASIMFSAPNPNDEKRFDRPFPIRVTSDGIQKCSGEQLMVFSSTLEKLILGTKPFWGGKSGPIRTSVLPYPVPSVTRWLLPMMYGNEDRRVPQGAMSFSSESLEITCPTAYVIDGEFFDGPENAALKVETGPMFTYLCG